MNRDFHLHDQVTMQPARLKGRELLQHVPVAFSTCHSRVVYLIWSRSQIQTVGLEEGADKCDFLYYPGCYGSGNSHIILAFGNCSSSSSKCGSQFPSFVAYLNPSGFMCPFFEGVSAGCRPKGSAPPFKLVQGYSAGKRLETHALDHACQTSTVRIYCPKRVAHCHLKQSPRRESRRNGCSRLKINSEDTNCCSLE